VTKSFSMQLLSTSRAELPSSRRLLGLVVAFCYLGLAVLGAICLFDDSTVNQLAPHHAGHAGKTSHSPLCAWACQAGPAAPLMSFSTVPFAFFVLWAALITALAYLSQISWAPALPRSPPVPLR
jgi:hypothetical protein